MMTMGHQLYYIYFSKFSNSWTLEWEPLHSAPVFNLFSLEPEPNETNGFTSSTTGYVKCMLRNFGLITTMSSSGGRNYIY